MNDKAVEAGDITVLRKVLTTHWLADMICDHKNQTDKAICSCSLVNLPVMNSVGAAANTWIEHVIQAYLAALPPAPVDEVMVVVEKYAAKMKIAWGNILELSLIPEHHRMAAQILHQESSEILTRLRSLTKEPTQ